MLECASEVEEIWKLGRGMGDYSRIPVVHINMIIFFFCPHLRQNLDIKATSDMFPMINKPRREGRSTWTRAANQLLYVYPRCLLSPAVVTEELSEGLSIESHTAVYYTAAY